MPSSKPLSDAEALVEQQLRTAEVVTISTQICKITEIAASAIAADLSRLDVVPAELGEMYEDLANVFLNLAEQVRLKQR